MTWLSWLPRAAPITADRHPALPMGTHESIIPLPPRPRSTKALRARALLAAIFLALCVVAAASATAPHPLQTAIVDPDVFTGPDAALGLEHAVSAGAGAIKIPLFWNEIAPAKKPRRFSPANPADPAYNWASLDTQLRLVHAHGLTPIVYIAGAPAWAFAKVDGASRADPAQYRAFALAAVRRYSGHTPGMPRVRYWQAWNEPNKVVGRSAKAGVTDWYATLVDAFAASVHSVAGNKVIAGGLAPFGISTSVAPLTFMRRLLCVSAGSPPRPTCSRKLDFDIWSTDPYTAGGPTHVAAHAGDVSVAELPAMKSVLDAGVRAGHISSGSAVRFWVTEFSWDSKPPDPGGVPAALEGRWVSEALYRMWSAGVSLVTWFTLRDQPFATSPYQSGLYYRGATLARDRPKPAFTAFRFPFVAFPQSGRVAVWGRTPTSAAGKVLVEQYVHAGWRRLAVLQANGVGIFLARLHTTSRGPLRAVISPNGATSLSFSLANVPDRTFQPFGAPMPALASASPSSSSSSAVSQYVEVAPTASGRSGGGTGPPSASAASADGSGSVVRAVADAVGSAGTDAGAFVAAILATTIWLLVAARRARRA
jgi:hypothetical protein